MTSEPRLEITILYLSKLNKNLTKNKSIKSWLTSLIDDKPATFKLPNAFGPTQVLNIPNLTFG